MEPTTRIIETSPRGRHRLTGAVDEAEMARILDRTPRTLRGWRYRRIGPPFFRIGATVMYRIAAVEEWLRAREVGGKHQQR